MKLPKSLDGLRGELECDGAVTLGFHLRATKSRHAELVQAAKRVD